MFYIPQTICFLWLLLLGFLNDRLSLQCMHEMHKLIKSSIREKPNQEIGHTDALNMLTGDLYS